MEILKSFLLCGTAMVFHLLQVDRPRPCTARGAEERRVTAGVGHDLGKYQVDNLQTFVNTWSLSEFDNWTGQIGQSLSSSNGRRCLTVTDECCSIASMWIEQMKRKFAQTLSMTQMGFLLKNKHYPLSECCIDGNLSNDSMYGKYIFLKWISTVPID